MGRKWTTEEEMQLERIWGTVSLKVIMKMLDRSEKAVKEKAWDLNLGSPRHAALALTVFEVARRLGKDHKVLMAWRENAAFPAYRLTVSKKAVWVVKPAAFWEWVRENPDRLSAAEIPKETICPEPEWVAEMRRTTPVPRRRKLQGWTTRQKEEARRMIDSGMTNREVAAKMGRTISSVTNEISRQKRKEAEKCTSLT